MARKLISLRRANNSFEGMTLIEILIVLLIIGVLIAISLPTLTGQTKKAKDSDIKQMLILSYKAAKAYAADNEGNFGTSRDTMSSVIGSQEPGLAPVLTALTSQNTDILNPRKVYVVTVTNSDLVLAAKSAGGAIWVLSVSDRGKPTFNDYDGTVAAPTNISKPIINGIPYTGNTLNATNGTWTGTPSSYSRQWKRCNSSGSSCTNISGATSASYVVVAADKTYTLRVAVTATNSGGSSPPVDSDPTAVVTDPPPPVNTGAPVISGTTMDTYTLTTDNGTWDQGSLTYTYAWYRCTDNVSTGTCSAIGATGQSYTLTATDVYYYMRTIVTARNSLNQTTPAWSGPTAAISAYASGGS